MTTEQKQDIQIVWHQVSIIERFSSVLYPLDITELLRQLPTIGYVVPDLVLRGTPEAGKPIAQKGDVELAINQDNKTIGIRGREAEKAVVLFKELRDFYLERLDPSPGLATQYLELNGEGWAKSGNNPNASFASFWADYKRLEELGVILESDVVNFGIQIVPPNKDPNNPEWFHIYLEPLIPSAARRYHIRCIWRGTDVEHLLKKFAKIDETLRNLIKKIEGK